MSQVVVDQTAKLPRGIYFQGGTSPPPHFALMLLRVPGHKDVAQVAALLTKLWEETFAKLKGGFIDDLDGVQIDDGEALEVLLGYGAAAFRVRGCTTTVPEPLELGFAEPRSQGGGSILIPERLGLGDSRIDFDSGVMRNAGNAAFAVQFTAKTALAVERAVVETWKVLHDEPDGAALEIVAVFTGAHREDGRSWLDFYDGISNLSSAEREGVIPIKDTVAADEWTRGGTYMAFMRLGIDLAMWRDLGHDAATRRDAHERIVGRDKHSGCAIAEFTPSTTVVAGCPATGSWSDKAHADFHGTPEPSAADATLRNSHVQRANHHRREGAELPTSLRIYRQGYPFFEPGPGALGFRAGLNFVSFQDTPSRVIHLLTEPSWFGAANFGGPDTIATSTTAEPSTNGAASNSARALITAYAAGFFLVPPVENEPFPGASVFG